MHPINIDQLDMQIKRSKNVEKRIANQSAIVMLGKTGAGKSTTILTFLGHKMIKTTWKGIPWITPERLM